MTKSNLSLALESNPDLFQAFTFSESNAISNSIYDVLNMAVNAVAPSKVVQVKDNYLPYIDPAWSFVSITGDTTDKGPLKKFQSYEK